MGMGASMSWVSLGRHSLTGPCGFAAGACSLLEAGRWRGVQGSSCDPPKAPRTQVRRVGSPDITVNRAFRLLVDTKSGREEFFSQSSRLSEEHRVGRIAGRTAQG